MRVETTQLTNTELQDVWITLFIVVISM